MMLKIENLAERAQEPRMVDDYVDNGNDNDGEPKWFHINTMIGNTTKLRRTRRRNTTTRIANSVDFESK